MPISTASTSPLFTIIGPTGPQGRSIIRAIHNSSSSNCIYRVRAITRSPSSPSAQELIRLFPGVELMQVDNVFTLEGAKKAFHGSEVVFAQIFLEYEGEASKIKAISEGKALMDAAKAEGVKTVVWSGQLSLTNESGGKHPVKLFDIPAEIATYGRNLPAPSFRLVDVQPGAFMTNYLTFQAPRKQDDGSFVLALVLSADAKVPVLDVEEDYGKYVVGAVEKGDVDEVHAAAAYITPIEQAEVFSKVTGKIVTFSQMPAHIAHAAIATHRGSYAADMFIEMFNGFSTIGYFAGRDLGPSNALLPAEKPARSFEKFLLANKGAVDAILNA